MKVLIAGGGRTGEQLASLLLGNHHHVRLIEHRREILALLHRELPTEVIYEGDPTDPMVLEQAALGDCDVVAACTDNDADNLVLCQFAKVFYNVRRTIARVNNPRNAWLFDDKFHVDFALNQAHILAALIEEEMAPHELVTLLKLQRGRYALVEERIPAGSPAIGVAIKDLDLPAECVIAAILRGGDLVVPRGLTVLAAEDEILCITDQAGAARLAALLAPRPGL
jgi:trk system potassium uptake protein TrkA